MEEDDWKKIRANWKELVGDLQPEDVKDHLYQEGILSEEHMEEISPARGITPQESIRRMLKCVKKHRRGFTVLCDALRSDYPYLAEKLEKTVPTQVQTPDDVDSCDSDKLKTLQQQLYIQVKMMVEYRKELEDLQSKVKENETESDKLKMKYEEIEHVMTSAGLKGEEAVNILRGVLQKNKDGTDMPDHFQLQMSEMGSTVDLPPANFTETVARTVGVDVVKYMAIKGENSPPTPNVYAETMRRLVTEITAKHGETFQDLMKDLYIDEINGFQTLQYVANELFHHDGKQNWGRIVVLYAFGSWVARDSYKQGHGELAQAIGEFLGIYVARNLGTWIEENGGWVSIFIIGLNTK